MEMSEMATVKEELIEELNHLRVKDLVTVREFVRVLLEEEEDLTPEEAAEFDAGQAEITRGEWVRWEEIRRTDV